MLRRSQLRFLLVLAAGCGGNVVYVDDGGGGSGSGAAGPVGPGPTTSGPSTNTSDVGTSVTTGFMSACQQVCSVASQCFTGDCETQCGSLYVPGCEAETDAFLYCAAASLQPGQCELVPGACESESAAYDQCINGNPNGCSQPSCAFEVCWCSAECFGGTLVADCDAFGPSTCACYFNDEYIGSCDGQTCQVDQSCCYDLLVATPD